MSDQPDQSRGISRITSSRVIRRAIELDERRGDSIAEEDLYAIARDLDISEAAVAEALQETVAGIVPRRKPWSGMRSVFRGWAFQTGLCGLSGGAAMLIMNDGIPLHGWFPFVIPLLFAALARRGKRHKRYQIQNIAYWLGLTGTWIVLLGNVPGGLIQMTAGPIGLTGVVGALLIGLRRREPAKGAGGSLTSRFEGSAVAEVEPGKTIVSMRVLPPGNFVDRVRRHGGVRPYRVNRFADSVPSPIC